jgi:hypothetical protein
MDLRDYGKGVKPGNTSLVLVMEESPTQGRLPW